MAYPAEIYHVGSIGIFGSCRRGEEHEESDVDILVEFSEVPRIFGFIGALSNISPNFSDGRWTRLRRALKPRIGRCIQNEMMTSQSAHISDQGM
jgi:hypothetical protein